MSDFECNRDFWPESRPRTFKTKENLAGLVLQVDNAETVPPPTAKFQIETDFPHLEKFVRQICQLRSFTFL